MSFEKLVSWHRSISLDIREQIVYFKLHLELYFQLFPLRHSFNMNRTTLMKSHPYIGDVGQLKTVTKHCIHLHAVG
jgi:hypothetical protein